MIIGISATVLVLAVIIGIIRSVFRLLFGSKKTKKTKVDKRFSDIDDVASGVVAKEIVIGKEVLLMLKDIHNRADDIMIDCTDEKTSDRLQSDLLDPLDEILNPKDYRNA